MYDTYVTVIGNVLTAPEWRKTKNTGSLVAHFKVASTARRLDRESGQWVDGNSFRVRVNCWRKLAEGVGGSLITGDPVIVVGRLYTRDWTDENNNRRIGYELEAVAVGHDLSRGQSKFLRNRPALSTSAVEDGRDTVRIGGEATEPVPPDQVPARRADRDFDDVSVGLPVRPDAGYHPPGAGGGFARPLVAGAGEPAAPGDDLVGPGDDLNTPADAATVEDGDVFGADDELGGELTGDDLGEVVGLTGEAVGLAGEAVGLAGDERTPVPA